MGFTTTFLNREAPWDKEFIVCPLGVFVIFLHVRRIPYVIYRNTTMKNNIRIFAVCGKRPGSDLGMISFWVYGSLIVFLSVLALAGRSRAADLYRHGTLTHMCIAKQDRTHHIALCCDSRSRGEEKRANCCIKFVLFNATAHASKPDPPRLFGKMRFVEN